MKSSSFRISSLALALVLSGAALSACGGSTPPPESADAEPAADESAEAADAPVKFDDMSAPEKMQHMKTVVAPEMAKVFQAVDADAYADFGCPTCHGPGAKNGNFEMPTDSLPALNQEEMDEHPEVTKFMMEQVVPKMAELLGEQPYNPETHEGFGCYDCHTKKE
jgi:hypothetical protein